MRVSSLTGVVRTFVDQNRGKPFDPKTTIEEYRENVTGYIAAADREKLLINEQKSQRVGLFNAGTEQKVSNISPDFQTTSNFGMSSKSVLVTEQEINSGTFTTKVRIYTPVAPCDETLRPTIIYFTGSGFVHSDLAWQKRNCKGLAKKTGCIVINPQEHVAPEYKFPKGLDECFELTKWVILNGDELGVNGRKISLCGFSSGGNFVAVIARRLRDANLPILNQCLISPWLDLTCSSNSYNRFGSGYLLDREVCNWLRQKYVNKIEEVENPEVSPLLYEGKLNGLPPTIIIVGENDPFVDECEQYAKKLQQDGVPVIYRPIKNQIHEFGGCNRFKITVKGKDDPIEIAAAFLKEQPLRQKMNWTSKSVNIGKKIITVTAYVTLVLVMYKAVEFVFKNLRSDNSRDEL